MRLFMFAIGNTGHGWPASFVDFFAFVIKAPQITEQHGRRFVSKPHRAGQRVPRSIFYDDSIVYSEAGQFLE